MQEKFSEKVAEAPSIVLEASIETTKAVVEGVENQKVVKEAKHFWNLLGPGLTTGSADDDPSGIATYSQTGARYGNQLLWLAPFTFPMMGAVQEMCARIGIVTGRGLAANIRKYFPRWALITVTVLLFAANSFNIGADLGALAEASQLLWPSGNFTLLVVFFTLFCLAMQIFVSYQKYAKYLKFLALILFSYVITAFLIKDFDWSSALRSTVIPSMSLSKEQIILICGILGTTISPYLFFWQTSQEVEERILVGEKTEQQRQAGVTDQVIKDMRIDNWSGMLLSNLAFYFIVAVCSATLFRNGVTNITTAADAAEALKPLAGNGAYALFSLGIFSVGLLGIPVLAGSASYAISESFGWKEGLYRNLKEAGAFYGVIIFSMLVGLALNFIGIDPIKALIYSAVANGLVAPVVLIFIVLLSANKKIMNGRHNHWSTTLFGWFMTAIMVVAGLATIYSLFF
jgi:NRAMP (natural resistance-associated macrophage protein)-like metal ion transporter